MRNYRATPEGKKRCIISCWKNYGLIDDYELVYDKFINTEECEKCKVKLTCNRYSTPTRKVMDHDHRTGKFRMVLCHNCNCGHSRTKPKNNTSGYMGINYEKTKNLWMYSFTLNGKRRRIRRKNKIDILTIKFCYMLLSK
jgi:hypothetical protein